MWNYIDHYLDTVAVFRIQICKYIRIQSFDDQNVTIFIIRIYNTAPN